MHRQNKRDVQERKKKQLKFSSFLATTEEKFKTWCSWGWNCHVPLAIDLKDFRNQKGWHLEACGH